MRHVKYISEEDRKAAHAEAQRRHIERKRSGVPTRKRTEPKMISNADEPFTLTDWKQSES